MLDKIFKLLLGEKQKKEGNSSENIDKEYSSRRKVITQFFEKLEKVGEDKAIESLSKNYNLIVSHYKTGENTWAYSKGVVKEIKTGRVVTVVMRNYSHFWYSWVLHKNGNEYLLCGEDYQGQTVINLTKGKTTSYFPKAGYDGSGFCWAAAYASPDSNILAVNGCYWACPYDIVFFDFTNPDNLPYRELKRIEAIGEVKGWNEDGIFELTHEVEVRKSDGIPYRDLSEKEQEEIDKGLVENDYLYQILKIDSKNFLNNV